MRDWPATSLLGRLRPPLRGVVLRAGTDKCFRPNAVILRQGDLGHHAVLILSGATKVVASTETGDEILLAVRVGGDLVGEMGAVESAPRSATVLTCGAVQTKIIHQPEFLELMRAHADLHIEIVRMISQRLRWANQRRLDFVAHDASTRIARVLLELVDRYGHRVSEGYDLGVALTQSELASIAGVALATTEKALHRWGRDGLVVRRYRHVVVTDVDRLREAAWTTGKTVS